MSGCNAFTHAVEGSKETIGHLDKATAEDELADTEL